MTKWWENPDYGYTGPGGKKLGAINDPDFVKAEGKTIRCADTHPVLKITDHDESQNTYEITGGSCYQPVKGDYHVEIGFDSGMRKAPKNNYPWDPKYVERVLLTVPDSYAPKNPKEFRKLVEWTADQLRIGRKVHAGCIGGHGRTGTFLAALVAYMQGEKDAIQYVRANYCKKAVESPEQVDFLVKNYGCSPAPGAKFQSYGTSGLGGHGEKLELRGGSKPVWDQKTGSSGEPTPFGPGMSALDWQRYMAGLDKKLGG